VIPSARQLAWQRLGKTAFLHFGVNTCDGRTLGTGSEEPTSSSRPHLNTDQWVQALRKAGFTEAILTVKDHDGFLLFPSKYSKFGVASSSWAGGKGDVVRNFSTLAHKFGLKVGLYLSPADPHEALPGGRYFNGSPNSPRAIHR
jgi:alpha-L-fucosidase